MLCHYFGRFAGLLPISMLALLLSYSPAASAQIEQFSVAQCAQLEAALELNREQQRRGYKLKQELKIKAQQAQLELQLHYHCQQPTDQLRAPQRAATRPQLAKTVPPRPTLAKKSGAVQLQISMVEVKAPYQGAKLEAWLQFYQPPFYCFGVRLTERIRQCVEQRQLAQQRFEQQYGKPATTKSQ